MNYRALSAFFCLATSVVAQAPSVFVQPFEGGVFTGGPTSYIDSVSLAAIHVDFESHADVQAMLFAHTTIEGNQEVIAGLQTLYPHLILPASAPLASTLAIPGVFDVASGSNALFVPVARVHAFMSMAVASSTPIGLSGGGGSQRLNSIPTWQAIQDLTDERYILGQAQWTVEPLPPQSSTVNELIGTRSLADQAIALGMQVMWNQSSGVLPNAPEISLFLEQEVTLVTHLQLVTLDKRCTPPKLEISKPVTVRNRSQKDLAQDAWWMVEGPQRFFPFVGSPQWVHVAIPTQDILVPFSSSVASTDLSVAYHTNLGVFFGEQLGIGALESIGRFSCPNIPPGAVAGQAYFINTVTGQPVIPHLSFMGGAPVLFVPAHD